MAVLRHTVKLTSIIRYDWSPLLYCTNKDKAHWFKNVQVHWIYLQVHMIYLMNIK